MEGNWKHYLGFGMAIVIGMIMMTIGYYVFPSMLEGADTVRAAGNITEYIALEPMTEVGPTLALMGFTFAGVGTMFVGGWGIAKTARSGKSKGK